MGDQSSHYLYLIRVKGATRHTTSDVFLEIDN